MTTNLAILRGLRGLRLGTALTALAVLSACGGGGGSTRSTPAPPPPPPPAPTPAPSPTPAPAAPPSDPAAYQTGEYRRSDGPEFHNAIEAWTRGYAGAGVTLAIVDSGIDTDSPEFAGRVSSASRDVAGNGTVEAEDDHGTNVALVAAAARDNTGVMGIAFQANILAIRADEPGSCATEGTDDEDGGCKFQDRDIAAGINHAVSNGAAVVNLSLGGGRTSSTVLNAVRNAASRGVVVIVSAGNDGATDDTTINPDNPDLFAQDIRDAGGGYVIIVGSVDDAGGFSAFSNRAGSYRNAFLSARGERICCVYEDGELFVDDEGFAYVFSGTSFAAPQVTGAVALLKQAFPNMSGSQIVELLLDTARDAGTAGVDATYGRGILDIGAAFRPQGTTSIAGTTTAVQLGEIAGQTSPAMGDAGGKGGLSTVITDKYERAYSVDLAANIGQAEQVRRLAPALEGGMRHVAIDAGRASLAFTVADAHFQNSDDFARELQLTPQEAEQARVLAARAAMRIDASTSVALGYAQGADGLAAQLQGQSRPAFMIARDAGSDNGFYLRQDSALAVRHEMGDWGVTVSAGQGEALLSNRLGMNGEIALGRRDDDVRTYGVGLDRSFGKVEAALGLGWMDEERTVLGARFGEALGVGGADTFFLDGSAGWTFAPQWRLGASARYGVTDPRASGFVTGASRFDTSAWSADVVRYGVFGQSDSMALRLSQPLRVEGGGLSFALPVDYDYATESASFGTRTLSLSPTGREINGEIAWRGPLWGGNAAASLFYRNQPGHIASQDDDKGAAVRWTRKF